MDNHNTSKYRWVILFACALTFFAAIGFTNNVFSVFIVPITEEFGIIRTAFTLNMSLMYFCVTIGASFSWNVYFKIGMRRTMRIASVLLVAAYFTLTYARSMPGFYIRYCIIGLSLGFTTTVPLSYLLKRWFPDKSGSAMGFAFMGSGLAGVVFNPVAEHFISDSSWRSAFFVFGIIMAVCVLVPVFFLLKDNPDYEVSPESNGSVQRDSGRDSESSADLKSAESPEFQLADIASIFAMLVIMGMCGGNLIYTVTPFLQDKGYTSQFAAVFTSVTMAAMASGKIVQGVLIDKVGIKRTTAISLAAHILGLIGMAFLVNPVMFGVIALGIFQANPFNTVALPVLPKGLVAPEFRDKAVGLFTGAGNMGYALSPIVSAAVYDITDSYVPIYYASIIILIPISIILIKMFKYND